MINYTKKVSGYMRKYIKVGDIISLICLIIICVLIFFLVVKKEKVDDGIIEISFKNQIIDEIDCDSVFESLDEIKYEIIYDHSTSIISIYKNGSIYKKIPYTASKDFNNTILIKDGSIKMIEASCSGKDCMKMEINKNKTLPIVCTNGVNVRIKGKNQEIDIVA